jgi:hypothetical protein
MRPPGRRRATRAGMAAGLAAMTGGLLLAFPQERFPHDKHARLFPTCGSCHAGIAAGDTARFVSITPGDCAGCHDGAELDAIAWTGYERSASNLAFPHPTHVAALEMDCAVCHNLPDAETRMAVQRAVVGACLECHAPDAEDHLDLTAIECTTCHVPLAQVASLSVERIAGFPPPPIHDRSDFRTTHGSIAQAETADCAICHARESCERCHRNAERIAPIQALARDSRIAEIVAGGTGAGGRPMPPSHRQDWLARHGEQARERIEGCASCHVRSSCASCHGETDRPAPIERLPERRTRGPQGEAPQSRPPGPLLDPRHCLPGLPCRLRGRHRGPAARD